MSQERNANTKMQRRPTTISFAPLPFSTHNRSSPVPSSLSSAKHHPATEAVKGGKGGNNKGSIVESKGFRKDYALGDALRSRSHVIVEPSAEQAFQAVDSLRKHDFAFVKTTSSSDDDDDNGDASSYSYAILAFRSLEPSDDSSDSLEECMVFVTSETGSTRSFRREDWGTRICLVSSRNNNRSSLDRRTSSRRRDFKSSRVATRMTSSGEKERAGWVPPSIISFVPRGLGGDDDLSLLGH